MSDIAYKILSSADWATLQRDGEYAGSPVDLRDGYIHLSAADQLEQTAAKHYAGLVGLVLLDVDLTACGDIVVWEPSRGGAMFPHLYGRMLLTAVRRARRLDVSEAGDMAIGAAA